MDGRKNNKGTKGNKGGRPPKADELELIEQMDAVMLPISVWQAVAAKIEQGDVNASKLWLSYRFGVPKQQSDDSNNVIDNSLDITITGI